MIVIRAAGRLRLVTQPDHARLAAEVLGLWRTDGVPRHPRRELLLRAVREHDNGWREADAAPRVNREGWPLDFREAPLPMRRELWERAVDRFTREQPYVALLIAEHALAIHRDRRAEHDEWRDAFAGIEGRRGELLAETGLGEGELAADYDWLFLADAVSLALSGALERVRHGQWRAQARSGTVSLAPFPLAGATSFRLPCRELPPRRWAGETDLAGDLAAARWEETTVRLVPEQTPAPGGP